MIAEELQAVGLVCREEPLQEQPAKQTREHAYREEKARPARHPRLAVDRDAAARHDHVDVRVMGHGRTQVWRTEVMPTRAPRCLGSAAIVIRVSAEVLNRR